MPTPFLPKSDDRESRVSIRHRSTKAATDTSSAADEALQYVLERKLRKREGRSPPPRRQSVAPLHGDVRVVNGPFPAIGGLKACLSLCLVAGVMVAGAVAITSSGRSSHTVSGVLLFGAKPVASMKVAFVPATGMSAQQPLALTTSPEGRFHTGVDRPLRSGLYSVIVDPDSQSALSSAIPAIYRDAATTPLRVVVSEDVMELRLSIRR